MSSTSPKPSCFDDADQGISSVQKVVVPCQPSENGDFTVTDAMKKPSPDFLSSAFHETCLVDIYGTNRQHNNLHDAVGQNVQRLKFPIEEGSHAPESATCLKQIPTIEGRKILESNAAEFEDNLQSVHCDPFPKVFVNKNRDNRRVFHDGLDKMDRRNGRGANRDSRRVEFGSSGDEVDCSGHCDDVVALRKNYRRLLEKHQQFIVSNVQLHELNDELANRVKELEQELEQTRFTLEQEKRDKMRLANQVDSLQRTFVVLKEKIPKLSSTDTTTDNPPDEPGEWTSSVKEELRQTVILAINQQQELNGLYLVIKKQNEAIQRLSRISVHSGNSQKNLEREMVPKELELRHVPEGSSVLVPTDETPTVQPTEPSNKLLQKTFRSGIEQTNPQDGKFPSKDMTATTFTESSKIFPAAAKDFPTASKGGKQMDDSNCHPMVTDVEGSQNTFQKTVQTPEHSVSQERFKIDVENSDFVFVDPNHIELRICPLCNAEFSNTAEALEDFVMHVSRCNPPEDCRQCPMCLMKFDEKYTDSQIEMHVNDHFEEDRFQCLSFSEAR